MKLTAHKAQIVIEGTEQEASKIGQVAERMVKMDGDLVIVEDGCESGESWVTITYDSRFKTIAEVREIYKDVK